MSEQLITSIVTVTLAIIGVAILAVLVSKQSQTGNVIKAASSGFAQDLTAALSPVTGGTTFGTGFTMPTLSFS
jgi:hypothetical protein